MVLLFLLNSGTGLVKFNTLLKLGKRLPAITQMQRNKSKLK